jgi:hypothetical protein
MLLFVFLGGGAFLFTVTPRTKKEFLSAFARAPSSLLPCGVRNTHKYLAFREGFGQCPSPSRVIQHLLCFAQRARTPTSARSIGFCVILVCISSSSSSTNAAFVNRILQRETVFEIDPEGSGIRKRTGRDKKKSSVNLI